MQQVRDLIDQFERVTKAMARSAATNDDGALSAQGFFARLFGRS